MREMAGAFELSVPEVATDVTARVSRASGRKGRIVVAVDHAHRLVDQAGHQPVEPPAVGAQSRPDQPSVVLQRAVRCGPEVERLLISRHGGLVWKRRVRTAPTTQV